MNHKFQKKIIFFINFILKIWILHLDIIKFDRNVSHAIVIIHTYIYIYMCVCVCDVIKIRGSVPLLLRISDLPFCFL